MDVINVVEKTLTAGVRFAGGVEALQSPRDTNIHIILMPRGSIKSQGSNAFNTARGAMESP